jgi:hypothetical protein
VASDIRVRVIGDTSSFEKAMSKSSKSANGFGKSLAKAGKFAAIGLGALGAGAAVAGKKMIDMASDAAEVQSKMEVVFGRQLPKLTKEIDKFSAATGTSRFAMREQAADMGALLAPLVGTKKRAAEMSLQFTKLATDLGSFNNVPTADALLAIRSGLVGEAEPLRRFGVLLNEAAVKQEALRLGLVKGKEELTEQQKVQARASLIMQQTTLAQGDATRTAGSMANQLKALKTNISDAATELGVALLPTALKVVQAFNTHWPTIKATAKTVFDAVGAAITAVRPTIEAIIRASQGLASAARQYWPQVQEAAARVMAWYRGTLQPAIQNVLAALTAFWNKFGADITRIARTAFNTVATVVGAALRIVQGVIEGVLALIRGDWTQAWNSLKQVVSNVITGVGAIVRGFVSIAYTAMVAVGRALIDGIIAGAANIGERLGGFLRSKIQGAIDGVKGFFGISSPSRVTAEQIGKPLAEGVILGYVLGSAALPEKMKESSQKAIEAARAAVEASRGRLTQAFGVLAADALSAFDAIAGQVQTKTEKLLGKLQAARAASDRADAVTGARAALTAAQAGTTNDEGVRIVDAEAVKNAQKQLDDALWAQREFALQQRAEQERRELDARNTLRRRHFEEQLQALGSRLQKEGATIKEANQAVLKLLGKFGVDFKDVGSAMGKAWVQGLKEAIADAARGAGSLAKTIEKVSADIPGRAAGGPVSAGRTYMVGERGPELFVPGRSGSVVANGRGGGVVVNVYGDVTGNEIIETVRREINRIQKQNGRSVAV